MFIDDFNMPEKEVFGAQPPLEILRQWMQYEFWYDLRKQTAKRIVDTKIVAGMGHPGGGRTHISPRTLHMMHVLNMTFPERSQLVRIFGAMANSHLAAFEEDTKAAGDMMTNATIDLPARPRALPTPDKPHYVQPRDISRVVQGVLRPSAYSTRDASCASSARVYRVLGPLTNTADRVRQPHDEKLGPLPDGHGSCTGRHAPFGDFMRAAPEGGAPYEEAGRAGSSKSTGGEARGVQLGAGVQAMNLVIRRHRQRVPHQAGPPCRAATPCSSAWAAAAASPSPASRPTLRFKVFDRGRPRLQVGPLREDLKKLYERTGLNNEATVFLFNDTQVIESSFLEDINGTRARTQPHTLRHASRAHRPRSPPHPHPLPPPLPLPP